MKIELIINRGLGIMMVVKRTNTKGQRKREMILEREQQSTVSQRCWKYTEISTGQLCKKWLFNVGKQISCIKIQHNDVDLAQMRNANCSRLSRESTGHPSAAVDTDDLLQFPHLRIFEKTNEESVQLFMDRGTHVGHEPTSTNWEYQQLIAIHFLLGITEEYHRTWLIGHVISSVSDHNHIPSSLDESPTCHSFHHFVPRVIDYLQRADGSQATIFT